MTDHDRTTVTVAAEAGGAPSNLPPVVEDATFVVERDTGFFDFLVAGNDLGFDPEGEDLFFDGVEGEENGSAAITASGFLLAYTPDPGFVGTETLEVTISDRTAQGSMQSSATITIEVVPDAPPVLADLDVAAVDTATDDLITFLRDGGTIPAAVLAGREVGLSVEGGDADVAAEIGSVRLTLGDQVRVENVAPYALFGDRGGDFFPGRAFGPGAYALGVEVFSERGARGDLLLADTVEFTVEGEDPPGPTTTGAVIEVARGDGEVVVEGFGALGPGARPSEARLAALDTLRLGGARLDADLMTLARDGDDVVLGFQGVDDVSVRLVGVALDEVENLAGVGNLIFDGQDAVTDAYDVATAGAAPAAVWSADTVTFLTDADDATRGREGSDDVIRGLGGDDALDGLSGDDALYGGGGNDRLEGGAGDDVLDAGGASFPGATPGRPDSTEFRDEARGGAGRDLLVDGDGGSLLAGGPGADVFVYRLGEAQRDVFNLVEDFRFGEDRLLFLDPEGRVISDPERLVDGVFRSDNPTNDAIFVDLNPYGEGTQGERVVLLNGEGPDGTDTWTSFLQRSSVRFEGGGDITDGFFGLVEDAGDLTPAQARVLWLTDGPSDLRTATATGTTGPSEGDVRVTLALTTQEASADGTTAVRGWFTVEPVFGDALPEDFDLFLTLLADGTTARQLGTDELVLIERGGDRPDLHAFEVEGGLRAGGAGEVGSITAQGAYQEPDDLAGGLALEVTNEVDVLLA